MDKEYRKFLSNYKYRVLDYNSWSEYVKNEYNKMREKNLKTRQRKERKQLKDTPINFNW
tara:strand:- start:10379 stop:10555 length:177 start_codon:yes stop_codon:yes gene_type:complete